jgi:hypothetical protein
MAAFWIVFVPTAWTVVPGWSRWNGWWRILVLVGWVVAAVLIAVTAHRQSEQVDDLMGENRELRRIQQQAAGEQGLQLLLRHRCAGLQPYDLGLYVIDDETGELYSAVSSTETPSDKRWEPGRGATGYAYYTGGRVMVRGPAVSETYGLSEDEQVRYREKGTAIVVAMPVKNARKRTIGVLTADGPSDDGFLASDQGRDEHLELAVVVARFVIDLCGWDTDDAYRKDKTGSNVRSRAR